MNPGAFVYSPALLDPLEIEQAAALSKKLYADKTSVHKDGKYTDLQWFQAELNPDWPIARKLLDFLGATDPELLVFYYLEPAAHIHPHRDLTGASLNDRLRFHVPVVTNENVDFRVSGERVRMNPGDLWCLDTSYEHSVHNGGHATRVHIVIECAITPEIRANIPGGLKAKLHSFKYAVILGASLVKALAVNAIKDPAYLKAQLRMVAKYISWRFLGTSRAQ